MPLTRLVQEAMAARGIEVRINSSEKRQRATLWLRDPRCRICGRETVWPQDDNGEAPPNALNVIQRFPLALRKEYEHRSYAARLQVACAECASLQRRLDKAEAVLLDLAESTRRWQERAAELRAELEGRQTVQTV